MASPSPAAGPGSAGSRSAPNWSSLTHRPAHDRPAGPRRRFADRPARVPLPAATGQVAPPQRHPAGCLSTRRGNRTAHHHRPSPPGHAGQGRPSHSAKTPAEHPRQTSHRLRRPHRGGPSRRVPATRGHARRQPRPDPPHPPQTRREGRPGLGNHPHPGHQHHGPGRKSTPDCRPIHLDELRPRTLRPRTGHRGAGDPAARLPLPRRRPRAPRSGVRHPPRAPAGCAHPTGQPTHHGASGAVRQTTPLPGLPDPRSCRYRRPPGRRRRPAPPGPE